MFFSPTFDGRLTLDSLPADMTERIAARLEAGLLSPGTRSRANYRVVNRDADQIRFVAADWWTAFNIGLNDVTIQREDDGTLHFAVAFWAWTRYVVIGGLCLFAFMVAGIATLGHFGYGDGSDPFRHPFFWLNVTFWCLCWPWILVAMHKRPVRKCLEKILTEVAGRPNDEDGTARD